jgi:polysaccharide biosynthesis/export protein
MKSIQAIAFMLISALCWGQSQRPPFAPPLSQDDFISNRPSNSPTSVGGQEYQIGRDDLIEVSVFEDKELNGTSRVTGSGTISIPLLGPIEALGHTPQEVERSIEEALKAKWLNEAHVTVFVREYASQPVSVVGAVRVPSIYQIKGQKSLLDVLAMAQGLDPEAGNTIQVIRAKRPSNDIEDQESKAAELISINIQDLAENGKTELNIPIYAGDTVNVLRAGSIFVQGEVTRPNEFVLRNGKNVTVAQAIALANGFTKDAKKADCVVIRYHRDGTKEEIHADANKILRNQAIDPVMLPNDILFVPANKVKPMMMRALDSTITVAMARVIYVGF